MGRHYENEIFNRTRKYVKGYDFLSFARKFGDKYTKKLKDAATKTGIVAVKTASKRVVQKTAETTNLIGNNIADKKTSADKIKLKKKKMKKIDDKKFT